MIALPFTKLHGLGNDFVLIDLIGLRGASAGPAARLLTAEQIRALADRKRGVGFDQLLVLRASARVHARLDILNADASRAEMCGNGLRAAALYLWTRGGLDEPQLVIETDAGDRRARALDDGRIECEMGVPRVLRATRSLKLPGVARPQVATLVDVGNPHAVFFAWPSGDTRLARWGRFVEHHRAFAPARTNVEFVRAAGHIIDVRVWERGVGLTEACGTGAVAAACASIASGLAESPVELRFPGGASEVSWDGPGHPAYLRGHAREVFSGTWIVSDRR